MSAHNISYFRLFTGSLTAAEFVAFTQLLTKPRADLLPLQSVAIAIFAATTPLLVGFFLRPPVIDTPSNTPALLFHFALFCLSIVTALIGIDLLFWSISWVSGALFAATCGAASYLTFAHQPETKNSNTDSPTRNPPSA